MRAISTGLLALLLVPTPAPVPGIAVSMTDVTGDNSSSAPSIDGPRSAAPAASTWGTHADSLRAEALLPAVRDPPSARAVPRALQHRPRARAPHQPRGAARVAPAAGAAVAHRGGAGDREHDPHARGPKLGRRAGADAGDADACRGPSCASRATWWTWTATSATAPSFSRATCRRTSSSTAALLRYNGCVRGTNTPDCHRYPSRVLARAGIVRRELLAGTTTLALAAR